MEAGTPMCVEEPVPTNVMAPVMDCGRSMDGWMDGVVVVVVVSMVGGK